MDQRLRISIMHVRLNLFVLHWLINWCMLLNSNIYRDVMGFPNFRFRWLIVFSCIDGVFVYVPIFFFSIELASFFQNSIKKKLIHVFFGQVMHASSLYKWSVRFTQFFFCYMYFIFFVFCLGGRSWFSPSSLVFSFFFFNSMEWYRGLILPLKKKLVLVALA